MPSPTNVRQRSEEAALAQLHGGDVEFVGRPAGSELNADGLNPALQNALDKFTLDVTAKSQRRPD